MSRAIKIFVALIAALFLALGALAASASHVSAMHFHGGPHVTAGADMHYHG
jgi:hypothetical protein